MRTFCCLSEGPNAALKAALDLTVAEVLLQGLEEEEEAEEEEEEEGEEDKEEDKQGEEEKDDEEEGLFAGPPALPCSGTKAELFWVGRDRVK